MAPAAAAVTELPGSAAPHAPSGAVQMGTVQASQQVHLDIALNVRDKPALTSYLDGLTDRRSPYFHHFLAKGQFGPLFGPTLAQLQAVEAALTRMGLHPGTPTPDRLTIPVTATAAQVEHAFGITLTSYRLPGGRIAFANAQAPTVPASIAPIIQGVLGLNDLYQAQRADLAKLPRASHGRRLPARATATPATTATTAGPAATGPRPCSAATSAWPNTANVFAGYYGMSQLYGLGDLGAGQRIGVMEFEPNLPSDISAYESCYGISTPVNYIPVDGGTGSTGPGSGEAAMDIEIIAGLAPQATIDVYQAPNNLADMDNVLSQFVNNDTDSTMSISWGLCEAETPPSLMNTQANLADEATLQGQTILAASGDDGSTDCFNESSGDTSNALSINMPAGDPDVVSVGGTGFDSSGNEVVWNDSADDLGAGGGGLSAYWCMPDYQYQPAIPGIFDNETTTSTSCVDSTDAQGYVREAPDVSADADPNSGYVIYLDGSWQGGWGGTSASTPLMASIAALTSASPFCSAYHSGNAGVLPPALYSAVAADQSTIYSGSYPQVIRDITSGNDDYTVSGYTGGLYPATKGYDVASGLGAPIVNGQDSELNNSTYFPGYAALMCRAMATQLTSYGVTGVSPSSGAAQQAATVTVQGTGFLPIAGADLIDVYSGTSLVATESPSCTTTACTLSLPAEPAGTVLALRASVEDGAFTSATIADQYTYVASPPHVTSYTPVGPVRVLDTRDGTGGFSSPVGTGKFIALQVAGQHGVPASGVTAVVLNVTATGGTASSFVTAYPDGTTR
ncbi:MAG TPA: S53 family peptidase, partial [Trebonia sp.]|nr:S53 family peptidase [Trebonia sp.]